MTEPHASLPPRYQDVTPLGAGAFGRVYRAIDPQGRSAAVKVLDAERVAEPDAVWQFTGEYRRLARLAHPAFPQAFEEGRTPDGAPFYSMALVAGAEPKGPMPAATVRDRLAAVADALTYLHGLGQVHGDLKPENLRVDDSGRLTLLDVGLMAPVGARREAVSGTLEYLAPEALRKAPVEPAADMYALGALAFELWSGHAPFSGGPGELIRAHLQAPVPPVSGAPDSDPELERLIRSLLAKDPADRPSAPLLLAALGREVDPALLAAAGRTLRAGTLVGREAALDAWQAALDGPERFVAVTAPFGGGKSRFLEECRLSAQLAGFRWVGAACAGDTPALPLKSVVAQAIAEAGLTPEPVLAAWLEGRLHPDLELLEPPARKVLVARAVAGALASAATALGGLAVGLDDWHLADSASRDLVALLARTPSEAPVAWAIAGEPTETPAPGHPVELAPFDPTTLHTYLAGRLGAEPPAAQVDRLTTAEGNPLLVELLLDDMVASGALRADAQGWTFDEAAAPAAALGLSSTLAQVLAPRLASLPAEARTLAEWAAVGAPVGALSAAVLTHVAGVPAAALDALVADGVLAEAGGRVRLALSAYAGVLTQPLSPERLAAMRAALARALAATGPDALFQAARLAVGGDDPALALTLGGEAGRRSLEQAAPREALAFLEGAERALPPDADAATRLAVRQPKAEAEHLLDRIEPAMADYEAAANLATEAGNGTAAARAWIGLAKCRQVRGDYPGALEALAQARTQAAAAGSQAQEARALASEARLRAFRGEPGLAMELCARAAELARAGDAPALLAQALNLQGYLLIHEDLTQSTPALAMLDEAIALCERLGDRVGLGLALDNLGNAQLALGDLAAAQAAFDRYAENCRAIGAETESLAANLNQLIVLAERGDVEAALALGARVVARAEKAGRKFVIGAAQSAIGQALWRGGRLSEALAPFDQAVAIAEGIGNRLLEEHVRAFRLEALLALGDLSAAETEAERLTALNKASGNAEMADRIDVCLAELARQSQDAKAARAYLARLLDAPNRLAAHRAHQILARLALDHGEDGRAHAEQALAIAGAWHAPWHEDADRALLAEAHQAAGDEAQARALARRVLEGPGPNPFALAACGLLAGLPSGLAPLREQLARLDADARHQALLAHGLVGLEAVPTPQPAAVGTGRIAPTELLAAMDALAFADDEPAISRAALSGAMALARAERGYVLAYEGGRLRQAITSGLDYDAEMAAGFSQSIVEQVLFSQEPLYVTDASTDATWKEARSVMALQLKTVICLPLATPTQILGVLYMDRQALDPVLTEADVALLQAFATAAASAIVRERARAELETGYAVAAGLGGRLAERMPDQARRELLAAAIETVGAERGFWLAPDGEAWHAMLALDAAGREAAYRDVSRGIMASVAETGDPVGILDLSAADGWQERQSIQALGLRTVWCLPTGTPDGALLYLDTTAMATSDPAMALKGLEALVRYAAPLLV